MKIMYLKFKLALLLSKNLRNELGQIISPLKNKFLKLLNKEISQL